MKKISGFRPLTGIVLSVKSRMSGATKFLPPYGDGTYDGNVSFRPLTGIVQRMRKFSATKKRFRPLAGIVRTCRRSLTAPVCFRPLTGMVSVQERNKTGQWKVFAPLRGSYRYGRASRMNKRVFALLRGLYRHYFSVCRADLFSPPCGDCTSASSIWGQAYEVFAPLRGWYPHTAGCLQGHQVFAPLRGLYNAP